MISSFSQFLVEEEKIVFFTFGRMNPPTIGHGKLMDKLAQLAGRNPYKIFLSQSQDAAKNPLSYSDKVKHVRKMFPKHARNVIINKNVRTAIEAITALYDQGFRKVVMVVGQDRVMEFETLLQKYNGKQARHGFYNFQNIKVISAGERDPDAEGVEGMSASKMRKFASDNVFTQFAQGLPTTVSTKDARKLFNDVRLGMGLKEEKSFKNHVALDPVSTIREQYVAGKIFNIGDEVIIKETNTVAMVTFRGSNYVIVEQDGSKSRKWLDAIELIEQKASKQEANYQDKPKNDQKCINCTMWRDPNKCTAVAGDISPNGWCSWYAGGAYGKRGKKIEEKTDRWYKNQPEWGTPEATKKAKKMTPGQDVKEEKDTHVTKDGRRVEKGLWYNIQQRRKKGLPRLKPGDKNYPKTLDIE